MAIVKSFLFLIANLFSSKKDKIDKKNKSEKEDIYPLY